MGRAGAGRRGHAQLCTRIATEALQSPAEVATHLTQISSYYMSHMHTRTHAYAYAYTRAHAHTHSSIRIHTRAHMHTCTHAYAHVHTHILPCRVDETRVLLGTFMDHARFGPTHTPLARATAARWLFYPHQRLQQEQGGSSAALAAAGDAWGLLRVIRVGQIRIFCCIYMVHTPHTWPCQQGIWWLGLPTHGSGQP